MTGGSRKRQRRCHDEDDCAVCLSPLADGGAVTLTKCDHAFHKHCLDAWLDSQPVCPICRSAIGDSVVVTIRGIDFQITGCPTKPIANAIQSAMDRFANKYGAFTFRWPLPLSEEDVVGVSNLADGSPVCVHQPLHNLRPDAQGRRHLLLKTKPHRDWIPNADFQWGQLMLNREQGNESPSSDIHPSTSAYYRRPDNWVAEAVADHADGHCSWSRCRRLLEIERELIHDGDDDALAADDDAWAARRPWHVYLRQAIYAYEHQDQGIVVEADHVEMLEGPRGATPVRLPAGREHEEDALRREALQRKPLHLFGCPFRLEARGCVDFLLQLLREAEVLPPPPPGFDGPPSHLLSEISCLMGCEQSGVEVKVDFMHQLLRLKGLDAMPDELRERIEQHVLVVWSCTDGTVYQINPEAPCARGKLPELSEAERLLTVPGMRMFRSRDPEEQNDDEEDGEHSVPLRTEPSEGLEV